MSTLTIKQIVRSLNGIKLRSRLLVTLIRVVRAALLGLVMVAVWAMVSPAEQFEQLALGILTFLLALLLGSRSRGSKISEENLLLSLEIEHPKTSTPAASLNEDDAASAEWQPHLTEQLRKQRRYEASRLLVVLSSLVIPLFVSFITIPKAAPSLKTAIKEVTDAVAVLRRGATLRVLQGATEEKHTQPIELSGGSQVTIELLAQNMIEFTVNGGGFKSTVPTIELVRVKDEDDLPEVMPSPEPALSGNPNPEEARVYQSFQLPPVLDPEDPEKEPTKFSVAFAVTEPVDVIIPAVSSDPLARITVKQLPVPKVRLTPLSEMKDPWPDDQPLSLQIDVKAKNPLQLVRLLIKSGQRTSKELVANVMTEDKTELSTSYNLILESYVESDVAEVEIIAEAIDRSIPTPLAGYSNPLRITTASAYGRYRQALKTLREIKSMVDDALSKKDGKLDPEANNLARKAIEQSEQSPFFDGRDRIQIHRFEQRVDNAVRETESQSEPMLELSQELNDFLFEHELLDDRERDRDFFVAARGLSRLVEQKRNSRPVTVETVSERIKSFLNDREQRWKMRVERLPSEQVPASWQTIKANRPFHGSISKIAKLDAEPEDKAREQQLMELSETVVAYRQWIEDLEKAEDAVRNAQDQERQQGLASARNVLKELQKRQGDISQKLDRADGKSESDMQDEWPSTRMEQNTNLSETQQLEGQLRSLSPTAGQRIKAAIEAMEGTLETGNQGQFREAESGSDLAGRLLRQADSAAQRSQQQRQSRGRRRRVTGDNYYGQSVVGGDIEIKRDYQVDKRYREDVLSDIEAGGYDPEYRSLMENYLREIVR